MRARTLFTVTLFLLAHTVAFPVMGQTADPVVEEGGYIHSPDAMQHGGLLLRMQRGYVIATQLNTDVEIVASGLVSRVTVRQTFRNDGHEWVEGTYVFPLPEQAAVDHMRLYIGERFIEGDIKEKAEAKREYNAAKQAGKKASLVEQQRADLFTTSVANIAPDETVVVEIEYQQAVQYEEGMFSLRYPLTMTPRYIPGVPKVDRQGPGWSPDTDQVADASLITPPVVAQSDNHKVTLHATINAGMPLEFIASRYHPIEVHDRADHYELSLRDTDVPMDQDLELMWRPKPSNAPRALVFSEVLDEQPHVLVMVMPPDDATAASLPVPREVIFIIDTSGSMHGTSIEQARKALLLALSGLAPSDRFNVIQFNSVTHALFGNSVAATSQNVQHARNYVNNLQADGGTEMRPALSRALQSQFDDSYLRQIVFITDGSVGNEEALFSLIEQDLGAARLFTVGIGSAPNGWFMQKAAEAGRGSYTFISALHEVNEKMERLFRKLEQPQVTDINVEWPQGLTVDAYPATIPDLYAGQPVILRARLRQSIGKDDELVVSGNSVAGAWRATLNLRTGREDAGIATLWARARIADLEDRRRRGEDAESMRAAIVRTALQHHLVSKHTSLVAVDKTPARPADQGLGSEQVPSLLPHGQSMQSIFGMTPTATPAPTLRLAGFLCLLLAAAIWLLGRQHVHVKR